MKYLSCLAVSALAVLLTFSKEVVFAQEYLPAKPLTQVAQNSLKPVTSGMQKVFLISWGGDVQTITAHEQGYFKEAGLDVTLVTENNFVKQVESVMNGETPYLRGTAGMVNAAAEVFKNRGVGLTYIYQLTWSVGGDAMVVRPGKNLKNIKTVALQLYGPHMDYAASLFSNAGRLSDIQFKWLQELTLPTFETGGKTIDPVTAFQKDPSLDAVMCIIPDALMLTSQGKVGTGAEGSVKGSSILLTTKTASRVIADVYVVRDDYLRDHRDKVEAFVRALMRGQETLEDIMKSKSTAYRNIVGKSAQLLLGAPQATSDVESMLGDCEFVDHGGNITFFTGKGTTRSADGITRDVQSSFIKMGLMSGTVALSSAGWDYAALGVGLKRAVTVAAAAAAPKPKFDTERASAAVEKKLLAEPTKWETDGTIFVVEIQFEPNQSDFPSTKYAGDFQDALEKAQMLSGAIVSVEGHSDPLGILKAKQDGKSQTEIAQMEQAARNLSMERAISVRDAFLKYCKSKGITSLDQSQFVPVGAGVKSPKYSPPRTREEWAANRRVVFRLKQIEAELNDFVPLGK